MKPKTIIVTGAAGFIGRNVVEQLNHRGLDNLLLVDSLGTDEKWRNLGLLRYEDLVQPNAFLDTLARGAAPEAAAVIHLGACSATTEKDADFLLENNYRYTRTLAEWCARTGIRFVYASSAATYGDGAHGYSDDDAVTPLLEPLNMYGYSKHMFDLWALRSGLLRTAAGIKYFNVYGPFEEHKGEMRSLVNKAYAQISRHGYLELFRSEDPAYADGEQMRDFVYVRDAAAVTVHLALDTTAGGLVNCGAGRARTWLDLARALFRAMGRPEDIRFIDLPENLRGKYQYFTQAESAKLRTMGYLAPFTDIEEGVADYVGTHLSIPGVAGCS